VSFYNLLLYFLVSNTFAFNDFVPKIIVTESIESGLKNNISYFLPEDKVINETSCTGIIEQGGMVLCKTSPNTEVKIGRSHSDYYYERSGPNGNIIIGFDRDERDNYIEVNGQRLDFVIPTRDYTVSRIDGLPPSQVSSFNEEQLQDIRVSSRKKAKGFASRQIEMGFKDGFINPLENMNKTSPFGSQRILNGIPKKPHYGVDIAAKVGTKIYAPADGVISLSDDDLYFEGSMVLIDHGQGLISMYLHTEENLVHEGEHVKQGQLIATVGSKGRSTGPHLCWRLKWRNRNLDPETLTRWPKDDKKLH
jgi:murein DD-endopeptidase MepM/ murein hydrolase activator NlpD